MQFRSRYELLSAIGTQNVAEMGIAKFALENATLLLFHAAAGFQRNPHDLDNP
jgi:hypothetical protein